MSSSVLTILFLSTISIIFTIEIVLALLTILGSNTYLKAENQKKKIEVRTENSNL